MGTIDQLFHLIHNTDGAAVDHNQQRHLFIYKLNRFTLGPYLLTSDYQYCLLIINLSAYCCERKCYNSGGHLFPNDDQIKMIYCTEEESSEQNKQHQEWA